MVFLMLPANVLQAKIFESLLMSNTALKSALFVDFDNVYGALDRSSRAAADAFSRNPGGWLRWFELGGHEDEAEAPNRRILTRRCYLNPAVFGRYRHRFTIAGFQTIDCPALTSHGKNSADISMALDIMEALQHPTRFDEFIILSADADFTPVLLRLREHDRRTAVLSTEITVQALKAAADFAFEDELFIKEALGVDDAPPVRAAGAVGALPGIQAPIADHSSELAFVADLLVRHVRANGRAAIADVASIILPEYPIFKDSSWLGFGRLRAMVDALVALRPELRVEADGVDLYLVLNAPAAANDGLRVMQDADGGDQASLREAILDYVERTVAESDGPVHGAALGLRIIQKFGQQVKRSEWLGEGSLSRLILSGNRPGLAVAGYEIYDPERHGTGENLHSMPPALSGLSAELADLIEELASVGWPRLTPAQTALIIRETARLIREGVTERNPLSAAVRDAIRDAVDEGRLTSDLLVARASVNFLLNSLIMDGVVFEEDCATEEDLRRELSQTLINIFANRIGPPDHTTSDLIDRLLGGANGQGEPETASGGPSGDGGGGSADRDSSAASDGFWRPPVAPAWADAVSARAMDRPAAAPAGVAEAGEPAGTAGQPVMAETPSAEEDGGPVAAAFAGVASAEAASVEGASGTDAGAGPSAGPEDRGDNDDPVATIWGSSRQSKDAPKRRRPRGGWWQRFQGD